MARRDRPFDLARACAAARAALPRGSALLVVADAFDLRDDVDSQLADLGHHCDCTLLLAHDPWHEGLPLRGFARIEDLETGERRTIYVDAAARRRYADAVREREGTIERRFAAAGWRVAPLRESDGRASLFGAFGLAAPAA